MIQVSDDLKKLVAPYNNQLGKPKYLVRKIVVESLGSKITSIIQPTDTPNIFSEKQIMVNGFTVNNINFLGALLSLSSKINFDFKELNQFETAWNNVNVKSYEQNLLWQKADVGQSFYFKTNDLKYDCSVTKIVAAKTLHPNIQGNAKQIKCKLPISLDNHELSQTMSGYYLEDYHYHLWNISENLLTIKEFE